MKLLGDIIAHGSGSPDLHARFDTAMSMSVMNADLPASVDAALSGFLEAASEDRLRLLQLAVARSGLWTVGPERFVMLVAHLTVAGHLELPDAAGALCCIPVVERHQLSRAAQHLVDVADVVLHDARDGIMEIHDDEIFRDALRAFTPVTPATSSPG